MKIKELRTGEKITYDDFIIITSIDEKGNKYIKIMTDNGYVRIKPQTGNSFIVETTKENK